MANPISLPQPNMGPGGYLPPGEVQQDPITQFIQTFMLSQQAATKRRASEAEIEQGKQQTTIAKARLDLEKEKAKTETTNAKAQGEAMKILLPHLVEMGAANGMVQQMGGQGPQQAPQAPPQPQADPMQVLAQAVQGLPPEAVAGFMKDAGPMAQNAQAKLDSGRAFDKAASMTSGLLTPDQQQGMQIARLLHDAGAPKEMWEPMMPQGQIALAEGLEKVRGMKNARLADQAATGELVRLGLVPRRVGINEFVVEGAAKMLVDYVSGVRKDARQANIAAQADKRKAEVEGLEGTALELAVNNPDWTPAQRKAALRTVYPNMADGVLAKAALEAPKKASGLDAPANETQAKARMVFGPGRSALAVVNAMDLKGEGLGKRAWMAAVDEKNTGMVGAGIGAAGGAFGGPLAAVAGGVAGGAAGLVAAPIMRGMGRSGMSADQQRLFTSTLNLAASIYRPETGAQASATEVRQTIERYIPLSTDKPANRELKRVMRAELNQTLAGLSGLPSQLSKAVMDRLLSKHEQALLEAGVELSGTAPTAGAQPQQGTLSRLMKY
jgi:hypothetical protein